MERKRLKVTELAVKPLIVKGDARTTIKPGVSRSAQKKMDSIERGQRQALAQRRDKVLFD